MNGGFLMRIQLVDATTGSMGNRFAAGAILAICSAAIRAEDRHLLSSPMSMPGAKPPPGGWPENALSTGHGTFMNRSQCRTDDPYSIPRQQLIGLR